MEPPHRPRPERSARGREPSEHVLRPKPQAGWYREGMNPPTEGRRGGPLRSSRLVAGVPYSLGGMASDPGDAPTVPPELTVADCYERIVAWHRTTGDRLADERLAAEWLPVYRAILAGLPEVGDASPADVAFLFKEVLNGTFEWAYNEKDENGIPMAAYAEHGIGKAGIGDMNAVAELASTSRLASLNS
jgi:hypothetical protein